MSRLNKVIERIEAGRAVFGPLIPAGSIPEATWAGESDFDFVVYEMEHNPYNPSNLQLSLQFMLNRKRIHESGSLAPSVMPFVRVPPNGREQNEWIIKQVLDIGVYGIVFPMINTPEDAVAAIRACRYPDDTDGNADKFMGIRGHAPGNAIRYWGLGQPEYFERADVWPLDPQGEILPILQCETIESVNDLSRILETVPRPGLILISEGDMSVSMGYKGQPSAEVDEAVQRAAEVCRSFGVPYGSPQVNANNIEKRISDGLLLLCPPATRDMSLLDRGRELAQQAGR